MKPSAIIREARNLLFEKGWGQKDYQTTAGLCVKGALGAACADNPQLETLLEQPYEEYDRALGFLQMAIREYHVSRWNDEPGRTFSEVVEAFDKAEKLAEAAEND